MYLTFSAEEVATKARVISLISKIRMNRAAEKIKIWRMNVFRFFLKSYILFRECSRHLGTSRRTLYKWMSICFRLCQPVCWCYSGMIVININIVILSNVWCEMNARLLVITKLGIYVYQMCTLKQYNYFIYSWAATRKNVLVCFCVSSFYRHYCNVGLSSLLWH